MSDKEHIKEVIEHLQFSLGIDSTSTKPDIAFIDAHYRQNNVEEVRVYKEECEKLHQHLYKKYPAMTEAMKLAYNQSTRGNT